jgi:Ca2+-binding RTX toxin-like protein
MALGRTQFAVLAAGALLLWLGLAKPAEAVVTCAVNAGTATVTLGSSDTASLSVGGARQINVNGAQCGGTATTSTIDAIVVNGSTGNETLNLDHGGGAFAPGLTPEPTGTSEIELTVNLSTGTDVLTLVGGSGPDMFMFGSIGVALNDDDDSDLTQTGIETFNVNAGGGPDTVSGAGNDTTGLPFPSALTLNGDAGGDALTGGAGIDTVNGGAGADLLNGGGNNDNLFGGSEDDGLDGGLGNDSINGMSGTDTGLFASATSAVTVNLRIETTTGGAGSDTLTGVENVTGSVFADTLIGDLEANALDGAGGDDILRGELGADPLVGGDGTDLADYSTAEVPATVNLGTGTGVGSAAGDTFATVENVTGSDFNDSLTGDGLANDLQGGNGNDNLRGEGGEDILGGGAGNDMLDEGATANGSDQLSGGTGSDSVEYGSRSTDLAVSINAEFDDGAALEHDNVSTDVDQVITGSGNDVVTGDATGDRFVTGAGDDFLTGATGNDFLSGGPGTDTASYFAAAAGVSVDLILGTAIGGAGEDQLEGVEDLVGSIGDDELKGGAGANRIRGIGGADTIVGRGAGDRLSGGEGNDELSGRKGRDTLTGGPDQDLLIGGPGRDRLDGGAGFNQCKGGKRDRLRRCADDPTLGDLL